MAMEKKKKFQTKTKSEHGPESLEGVQPMQQESRKKKIIIDYDGDENFRDDKNYPITR